MCDEYLGDTERNSIPANVSQRNWKEFHLSLIEYLCAEINKFTDSRCMVSSAKSSDTNDSTAAVDAHPDAAPAEDKPPTQPQWRKGYLGLLFDEDHRIVRREGHAEKEVPLTARPQLWDLLCKLEHTEAAPVDREELARLCREAGLDREDADDEVILRTALCELRRLMKPLGIDPKSIRNVGVSLVDLSTA